MINICKLHNSSVVVYETEKCPACLLASEVKRLNEIVSKLEKETKLANEIKNLKNELKGMKKTDVK